MTTCLAVQRALQALSIERLRTLKNFQELFFLLLDVETIFIRAGEDITIDQLSATDCLADAEDAYAAGETEKTKSWCYDAADRMARLFELAHARFPEAFSSSSLFGLGDSTFGIDETPFEAALKLLERFLEEHAPRPDADPLHMLVGRRHRSEVMTVDPIIALRQARSLNQTGLAREALQHFRIACATIDRVVSRALELGWTPSSPFGPLLRQ